MEYCNEYAGHRLAVDTQAVAKKFWKQMSVFPSTKEERAKIVEVLENDGFTCMEGMGDMDAVIKGKYPIVVNFGDKEYCPIISNLGASCLASSRAILSEKEFYLLYDVHRVLEEDGLIERGKADERN